MVGKTTLIQLLLILTCAICSAATCEEADDGDISDDGSGGGDDADAIDPGTFDPSDPGGCNQGEPDYGTCTEEEIMDYVDCVQDTCGEKYKECLGDNYMEADFTGGKCETFMECSIACECDDTQCQQTCAMKMMENGCMMCMTTLGTCAMPCIPSCMGIPGT